MRWKRLVGVFCLMYAPFVWYRMLAAALAAPPPGEPARNLAWYAGALLGASVVTAIGVGLTFFDGDEPRPTMDEEDAWNAGKPGPCRPRESGYRKGSRRPSTYPRLRRRRRQIAVRPCEGVVASTILCAPVQRRSRIEDPLRSRARA